MRQIHLSPSERTTLESCLKNHKKAHVRERAQVLLFSDEGWSVKRLAAFCKVRTRTIYIWFNRWNSMGFIGLTILPGRGVKSLLQIENKELVKTVKKKPQSWLVI